MGRQWLGGKSDRLGSDPDVRSQLAAGLVPPANVDYVPLLSEGAGAQGRAPPDHEEP